MMKRILTAGICFVFMTALLTACGNSANTPEKNASEAVTEPETTPVENLDETEQKIFDAIVGTSFYDPSTARIVRGNYDENSKQWAIVVKGDNRVGGTLLKCYYVKSGYLDSWDSDYSSVFFDILEENLIEKGKSDLILNDTNITNINTALTYYWESKGL